MKIFVADRSQGKTFDMIQWLKEDDKRIGVVINETEKYRLIRYYGVPENQLVSIDNIIHLRNRTDYTLGIDNLNIVIERLLGVRVRND